jgi:hypothetical protein
MCGFYCFCYMNYGLDVEIQEGKTLHMHSLFQGPVDLTVRFPEVDFMKNTIKFLSVKLVNCLMQDQHTFLYMAFTHESRLCWVYN